MCLNLGNAMRPNPNQKLNWCDKFFDPSRKDHVKAMLPENIKEVRLTSENEFSAKSIASNIEKDFFQLCRIRSGTR